MDRFKIGEIQTGANNKEFKKYITDILKQMELIALPKNVDKLIRETIKNLDAGQIKNKEKLDQISKKISELIDCKIKLLQAVKNNDKELSQNQLQKARNLISDIGNILDIEEMYLDTEDENSTAQA